MYLPSGSVGTAQLANGAVTNSKVHTNAVSYYNIVPGAVGIRRIATNQVQVRVGGKCAAGSAIAAINALGAVKCNATLPGEVGTTSNTASVPTSAAAPVSVTSVVLPSGAPYSLPASVSYLAFSNPTATITSTGNPQHVNVSCTLTVGANTQTRTATIEHNRDKRADEQRVDPAATGRPGRRGERELPKLPYGNWLRAGGERHRRDQRDPNRQQQLRAPNRQHAAPPPRPSPAAGWVAAVAELHAALPPASDAGRRAAVIGVPSVVYCTRLGFSSALRGTCGRSPPHDGLVSAHRR